MRWLGVGCSEAFDGAERDLHPLRGRSVFWEAGKDRHGLCGGRVCGPTQDCASVGGTQATLAGEEPVEGTRLGRGRGGVAKRGAAVGGLDGLRRRWGEPFAHGA